jgi:hypothetical protein
MGSPHAIEASILEGPIVAYGTLGQYARPLGPDRLLEKGLSKLQLTDLRTFA